MTPAITDDNIGLLRLAPLPIQLSLDGALPLFATGLRRVGSARLAQEAEGSSSRLIKTHLIESRRGSREGGPSDALV